MFSRVAAGDAYPQVMVSSSVLQAGIVPPKPELETSSDDTMVNHGNVSYVQATPILPTQES